MQPMKALIQVTANHFSDQCICFTENNNASAGETDVNTSTTTDYITYKTA